MGIVMLWATWAHEYMAIFFFNVWASHVGAF